MLFMDRNILRKITDYSQDPTLINKILVSLFVNKQRVSIKKNALLKNLLLCPSDADYNFFISVLEHVDTLSFEDLIEAFEFVISPADKVINGAVYTPSQIRNYIMEQALNACANPLPSVCDFSCGCAGFLLTATSILRRERNISYKKLFSRCIYGVDIANYAIERAKILLSLTAIVDGEDEKSFEFNLFCGDALSFEWNKCAISKFNIIVGNPPYVCSRHLSDNVKARLKNFETCRAGHPDLYIPFFELGIRHLAKDGVLGLITMNTFFKSVNGAGLRSFLSTGKLHLRIIDFNNIAVFKSKSTYTCICLIKNNKSDVVDYCRMTAPIDFSGISFQSCNRNALNNARGWNLSNLDIIYKIEHVGTSLGKLFATSTGVATLKNDIYIFSPIKETDKFFVIFNNGREYRIERDICVKIINSNRISDDVVLDDLCQYIIFPYNKNDNKIFTDDFFRSMYPLAYKYLVNHRDALNLRDKGKGAYAQWFAFGRRQGFIFDKYKLFFPHIAYPGIKPMLCLSKKILFYNGMAAISSSKTDLLFLQKIMCSKIFWFYIICTSKPYANSHYSLGRNYIRDFGVPDINQCDFYSILQRQQDDFDSWLLDQYSFSPSELGTIYKSPHN